jgi:gas vesicle protein
MNNLKVIAAIAAGVLAGAALGLIFAPAKGKDTRNQLLNGAKDLADNLKKKIRNEAVETNIS